MTDAKRHIGDSADESIDVERALLDPSSCFSSPAGVLEAPGIGDPQRLQILERWELDSRGLAVASEEGMAGGEATDLKSVLDALSILRKRMGIDDHEDGSPTKF